jgi:hypothetical protein
LAAAPARPTKEEQLLPTRPCDLPGLPPPPISDWQRNKVIAAEDEVAAGLGRVGAAEAAALARRAAEVAGLPEPVVSIDEGAPWRVGHRGGAVELAGLAWAPTDVLHAVAHSGIPDAFPPHGAEFAAALVGLCERLCPEAAGPLAAAMDARGVHRDARERVARARRTAVYATGKESGVLSRIVLDGPPEVVVAQLYGVGDQQLMVRDADGVREVALERLRYFSYRFAGSGGSRV